MDDPPRCCCGVLVSGAISWNAHAASFVYSNSEAYWQTTALGKPRARTSLPAVCILCLARLSNKSLVAVMVYFEGLWRRIAGPAEVISTT
jgi:hypothetical protein